MNKEASTLARHALRAALLKQASAYNQYGLLPKLAADGDYNPYGNRRDKDPRSYGAQRNRILSNYGITHGKMGIRGKDKSFWNLLTFGTPLMLFNWKNSKQAALRAYDTLFNPKVTVEQGAAARQAAAKQAAERFAPTDEHMQTVLYDELMRRSEHNLKDFERTNVLRTDKYTAPNQTHLENEFGDNSGGNWWTRRSRSQRRRRREPISDRDRYTYKTTPNSYQSTNQEFLDWYNAQDEQNGLRREFDRISAGM